MASTNTSALNTSSEVSGDPSGVALGGSNSSTATDLSSTGGQNLEGSTGASKINGPTTPVLSHTNEKMVVRVMAMICKTTIASSFNDLPCCFDNAFEDVGSSIPDIHAFLENLSQDDWDAVKLDDHKKIDGGAPVKKSFWLTIQSMLDAFGSDVVVFEKKKPKVVVAPATIAPVASPLTNPLGPTMDATIALNLKIAAEKQLAQEAKKVAAKRSALLEQDLLVASAKLVGELSLDVIGTTAKRVLRDHLKLLYVDGVYKFEKDVTPIGYDLQNSKFVKTRCGWNVYN